MLEVMRYLRANGYKTCIVTGGGQDFALVLMPNVSMVSCHSRSWVPLAGQRTAMTKAASRS